MNRLLFSLSIFFCLLTSCVLAEAPITYDTSETVCVLLSKMKTREYDSRAAGLTKRSNAKSAITIARFDGNDLIDSYTIEFYKRNKGKYYWYAGDTTDGFAIADMDASTTQAMIYDCMYIVKMKDGKIKGGKGVAVDASVSDGNSGSYDESKFSVKADKKLQKLVDAVLTQGVDYPDTALDALIDYLKDKGYSEDE